MHPAVPDGHPRGCDFEPLPDGWDPTPVVNNCDGWEDDVRVPSDDERGELDDVVGGVVAGP